MHDGCNASRPSWASPSMLVLVWPWSGLYPEDPLSGLAVDQVVGGVEDLIVDTVPFLFAPPTDKVSPSVVRPDIDIILPGVVVSGALSMWSWSGALEVKACC